MLKRDTSSPQVAHAITERGVARCILKYFHIILLRLIYNLLLAWKFITLYGRFSLNAPCMLRISPLLISFRLGVARGGKATLRAIVLTTGGGLLSDMRTFTFINQSRIHYLLNPIPGFIQFFKLFQYDLLNIKLQIFGGVHGNNWRSRRQYRITLKVSRSSNLNTSSSFSSTRDPPFEIGREMGGDHRLIHRGGFQGVEVGSRQRSRRGMQTQRMRKVT
ncbi:hypothetical protein SUGI_0506700 [Cryptomeria japonica]|nr:hypothetical protein SUGI_0506700 [Cryptomeria japonica]